MINTGTPRKTVVPTVLNLMEILVNETLNYDKKEKVINNDNDNSNKTLFLLQYLYSLPFLSYLVS